jgi:hypothetical protein
MASQRYELRIRGCNAIMMPQHSTSKTARSCNSEVSVAAVACLNQIFQHMFATDFRILRSDCFNGATGNWQKTCVSQFVYPFPSPRHRFPYAETPEIFPLLTVSFQLNLKHKRLACNSELRIRGLAGYEHASMLQNAKPRAPWAAFMLAAAALVLLVCHFPSESDAATQSPANVVSFVVAPKWYERETALSETWSPLFTRPSVYATSP